MTLEPLLVALAEQAVDAFAEGSPLPFLKVGEHTFDDYGDIFITDADLDRIVRNFEANARRGDLPICNEEHYPAVYNDAGEVLMGPGAIGWISRMYRDGDAIYFVPDWNPAGERLLEEDRYRGISPELLLDWTDPETGEGWGLTAAGVALTNKPRMKALATQGHPLAAAEPKPGRVLAFKEHTGTWPLAGQTQLADGAPGHGSFKGTHSHAHPAFGDQGTDATHEHQHTHSGDADHDHDHDMAEMAAKSINDLPDSAFAHIEPGGEKDSDGKTTPRSLRHYPVHDKAHADNAAARAAAQVNEGGKPGQIAKAALPKIRAAQKRFQSAELTDVHVDGPSDQLSIAYAYPTRKRLPLMTAEQVKGARARFLSIDAAEDERDQAWGEIRRAAERHGVPVPETWRELKASESIAMLMQEGLLGDAAEDLAAGMLAPCVYQPPYSDLSRCPGFTRSDPDGDGDSDCCAMAAKGCNGYIQVVQVQPPATFVAPQAASYYHERTSRAGGLMPDRTTPPPTETAPAAAQASEQAPAAPAAPAAPPAQTSPAQPAQAAVTAAETNPPAATAAPVPAPAPAPAAPPAEPSTASPTATTVTAAEPTEGSAAQAADLAEVERILAAERRERQALTTRLETAEANVAAERDARLRMETATRMAEITSRVEALQRTGRILPTQRDALLERVAAFGEDDLTLRVLEMAPENSAVDMRERGSGGDETVPESQRLEVATKALMAERQQSVDPNNPDFFKNFKAAMLEVGRSGYRAR